MWISRRGGIAGERRGSAGLGRVTIGGAQPAVCTEGELRRATVLGPLWYYWAPKAGSDAMVLQSGDLGEEACVAGLRQLPPVPLEPGEALIGAPDSYIRSGADGITLGGTIRVEGDLSVIGTVTVSGILRAKDTVRLNGAVYINDIYQLDE